RSYVAQINAHPVFRVHLCSGELVADEELISNELHFLAIEQDVATPPFFEVEISRRLCIDLGVKIVVLGPVRVGGIEIFEVCDEPRAVEFAGPHVAHESIQPASAEQAGRVPHRVPATYPSPVGEGRTGENERAKELRPQRRKYHDSPARLAITNNRGLSLGLGVQGNDALKELSFRPRDIADRLAGDRVWQKTDEIAGVSGLERRADLAIGLETANTGPVAGPRIDDYERTLSLIYLGFFWRFDPHKHIIHRALKVAPVHDEFAVEFQHMGCNFCCVFTVAIATLLQGIKKKDAPLPCVEPVGRGIQCDVWRPLD